jgi:type IV secretion system protein VirD4
MSSQAPNATEDFKSKLRNMIAVSVSILILIYWNELKELWQSFFFRFAFIAITAIAVYVIFKINARKKKLPESTAHGSASFASTQELINYSWLYQLTSDKQPINHAGGFLLSRSSFKDFKKQERFSIELSREETCQMVLILGPTGTGKSRCFFLPNLRYTRGQSFICTDPKGELHKHTASFHNSLKFAPRESETQCFNWIPLCGTNAHLANLLARSIVTANGASKESFWDDAETNFLAALFSHAATFPTPTPAAAYDFLTTFEQEDLIEHLLNSPSKIARQFTRLFQQASENVRGNTAIGLGSKLSWLMDDSVRKFTSSSTKVFDFSQIREHATGIYWILSETDVAVLKPLTSLFFNYMLWSIKQKDGLPVTFYLDEFANVGNLGNFEVEITVLRGRNVSICAGIQSFSQLAKVYGHHAETIFRDNFLTKIYLHGLDAETAEKCSRSLGEFTHQEETISFSQSDTGKSETRSLSRNQRRLMTGDEIRRLAKDQFILVSGNNKPVILTKNYYSEPPRPIRASASLEEALTLDFESIAQRLKQARQLPQAKTRAQLKGSQPKQLTEGGGRKALPPLPPMPAELEIIDAEFVDEGEQES